MISFRSVSKVYPKSIVALRNINLDIAKGEFVFVIGPSGAGKSTLLRLLYRDETPTSGSVMVFGSDVGQLRPRQVPFLRRHIGVVFQDYKLLPDRTVYENVAFALRVTEVAPRDIRRRVVASLQTVGLADRVKAIPSQLSGGEQQRVAIARAIVGRPQLVIADEPTGNLDPQTAHDIMHRLLDVNRMGTTVVVATHASTLVDEMRQRVVAVQDGHVKSDVVAGMYLGGLK